MSRIRGIEPRVQKDGSQTRRNLSLIDTIKKNDETIKKYEEQASSSKDDLEKRQIAELLSKLPQLNRIFSVHRKIGEGTFSSVYLGSLRQHGALPAERRRWFAIKHLVPTAHPARVEHELRCLQEIGGKNNVIGVELCLRHLDTIVFIMPYIPHKKFSEYVWALDAAELRGYMRALCSALAHVHSFGVIHRDVKPSNFLYDRARRRYLLVDFGLAQRVTLAPDHADESEPLAKRVALDLSTGSRELSAPVSIPKEVAANVKSANIPSSEGAEAAAGGRGGAGGGACACAGRGAVCARCRARPAPRAPRAGTQGFRPPEVLLKCCGQTTAVDMWACGVVLASALTARYPLLRAADDAAALAELAALLGTRPLRRAAAALGRRMVTSRERQGLCLRKLAARLRPAHPAAHADPAPLAPLAPAHPAPLDPWCRHCTLPQPQCLCRDHSKPADEIDESATWAGFPDSAFALCAALLEPRPAARLSARAALQHPFLLGES